MEIEDRDTFEASVRQRCQAVGEMTQHQRVAWLRVLAVDVMTMACISESTDMGILAAELWQGANLDPSTNDQLMAPKAEA